jgi:hypothetical protein
VDDPHPPVITLPEILQIVLPPENYAVRLRTRHRLENSRDLMDGDRRTSPIYPVDSVEVSRSCEDRAVDALASPLLSFVRHMCDERRLPVQHLMVGHELARCKLEVHPSKTKIVYCKDAHRRASYPEDSFEFLSFTFRPRRARNRRGEYFVSFSPAISRGAAKRIRQEMRRSWCLPRRTDKDLTDLAHMFNPVIRGWIGYFGSYHKSALYPVFRHLNLTLVWWAMRKYRRLQGHRRRAEHWLGAIAQRQPTLFAPWQLLGVRPSAG